MSEEQPKRWWVPKQFMTQEKPNEHYIEVQKVLGPKKRVTLLRHWYWDKNGEVIFEETTHGPFKDDCFHIKTTIIEEFIIGEE